MEIYNSSVKSIIDTNKGQGDTIGFPHHFKSNYGMLFMFTDYDYNAVDKIVSLGNFDTTRGASSYKGSVLLPLPANGLKEESKVEVGGTELGFSGALAAQAFAEGGVSRLLNGIEGFKAADSFDLKDAGGAALIAAQLGIRGLLADTAVGKGISAATGQTTNDFKALTFNGVGLRTHSFEWRFFPENPDDSVAITKIRKKFMAAAHPTYNSAAGIDRVLFGYPQLVLPVIIISESENFYYSYRPCMIDSVDFTYASESGMSFLRGGKPVSVGMRLNLIESSIWTAEDYGRDSNGGNIDKDFRYAAEAASPRGGRD